MFVCYAQWRTRFFTKLKAMEFSSSNSREAVAKQCRKGRIRSNAPEMSIWPQERVAGGHAPWMMGTGMPLGVRNGSSVDDSHTIVTIPIGEKQRMTGSAWRGGLSGCLAVHQSMQVERDEDVAVSGLTPCKLCL
jgi:hypothetical protein